MNETTLGDIREAVEDLRSLLDDRLGGEKISVAEELHEAVQQLVELNRTAYRIANAVERLAGMGGEA